MGVMQLESVDRWELVKIEPLRRIEIFVLSEWKATKEFYAEGVFQSDLHFKITIALMWRKDGNGKGWNWEDQS